MQLINKKKQLKNILDWMLFYYDILDYFDCVIKKHETIADDPLV